MKFVFADLDGTIVDERAVRIVFPKLVLARVWKERDLFFAIAKTLRVYHLPVHLLCVRDCERVRESERE
jgi:hypothetical protein